MQSMDILIHVEKIMEMKTTGLEHSVVTVENNNIIPTDPATELASNCPVNASRSLSLNQLIDTQV